jgi:hypothetical protein
VTILPMQAPMTIDSGAATAANFDQGRINDRQGQVHAHGALITET